MSQREVAGGAITSSYVSLLESGQREPTLDVIFHLAKVLSLPVEELVEASGKVLAAPPEDSGVAAMVAQYASAEVLSPHSAAEQGLAAFDTAREHQAVQQAFAIGLGLDPLLRTVGRHADRVRVLTELLELRSTLDRRSRLRLLVSLASAQRDDGRLVDAHASVSAVLEQIADAEEDSGAEHVRALSVLISVLTELGRTEDVEEQVRLMLHRAEEIGDPAVIGRAEWTASMACLRAERSAEARAHLQKASRLLPAMALTLRDWLGFSRFAAGVMMTSAEGAPEALRWLTLADQTVELLGLEAERTAVTVLQARYETLHGDPARARDLYARAVERSDDLSEQELVRALLGMGEVLAELSETEEARTALRRAAELAEKIGAFRLAAATWRRVAELGS